MIDQNIYKLIEESNIIKKKKRKKLFKIGKKIEKKSSQMMISALNNGINGKKTIELSWEVDLLVNKSHRKRNKYINL